MLDVILYLESKGIDYTTSGKNVSPGWVGIRCINPLCSDLSNHLGINISSGNYKCYKCGTKGTALKFISMVEGCDYPKAHNILKAFDNDKPFLPEEIKRAASVLLPKSAKKPLPLKHQEYLESRNFDPYLLTEKYDLYGCEIDAKYSHRLIIPVYHNQKLVTFIARAVIAAEVKYKALKDELSILTTKETLYNFDTVKDTAVVVEGAFDVFRIGDCACGTLGSVFSPIQVVMLSKCKNVFIMLDPDASDLSQKLADNLSGIVDHVEIITIDVKDPAEMSEQDVRSLRKELRI